MNYTKNCLEIKVAKLSFQSALELLLLDLTLQQFSEGIPLPQTPAFSVPPYAACGGGDCLNLPLPQPLIKTMPLSRTFF